MGETKTTKTICRPPPAARSLQRGHQLASLPPAAARRRSLPLLRAAHFSSACKHWERRQRLARICHCLDRRRANGKRLHESLVWFAWRWKARTYKCDPTRKIRFSYGTLNRIYHDWLRAGRTPAALELRYRRGNRKASRGQVIELAGHCLAPETRSFSEAYRKLVAPGATESAYRYAMPVRLRAALAKLLAHRRREQALERAARQLLGELSAEHRADAEIFSQQESQRPEGGLL